MTVLWVVTPGSLVKVHQRFRGPFCLHHQGDQALMMEAAKTSEMSTRLHGVTTQKTVIFVLTAVRTSNPT
jgi:hypothetical protein